MTTPRRIAYVLTTMLSIVVLVPLFFYGQYKLLDWFSARYGFGSTIVGFAVVCLLGLTFAVGSIVWKFSGTKDAR